MARSQVLSPLRKLLPIVLLLLLVSAFSSCKQRPKGVMSKGKMKDVLYDYHLAQAMLTTIPESERSSNQDYIDAVLRKHGITQEDFDSSLVYYNVNAEDLKDIYSDLRQRFEEENQTLATITLQNYFRLYEKLSGMTGTALTEDSEFREI